MEHSNELIGNIAIIAGILMLIASTILTLSITTQNRG
jgi:hypothetical protein